MNDEKLYHQILETAKKQDINIISKHRGAQLLAIVFLYGNEDFIYNKHLSEDIKQAQIMFNIFGGCIPQDLELIKFYVSQLKKSINYEWLEDIKKIYGLDIKEWDDGIRLPASKYREARFGKSKIRR